VRKHGEVVTSRPDAEPASLRETLETGFSRNGWKWHLEYVSPGWEPAGSCARWTDARWAVIYYDADGTSYGRQFATKDKALQEWHKITGQV
jgi:hypothetical protein